MNRLFGLKGLFLLLCFFEIGCRISQDQSFSQKFKQYLKETHKLGEDDSTRYYLVLTPLNCPGLVDDLLAKTVSNTIASDLKVIVSIPGLNATDYAERLSNRKNVYMDARGHLIRSNTGIVEPVFVQTNDGKYFIKTLIHPDNKDSIFYVLGWR